MPHLHIMQNHRCGYGHLPQRIHKLTLRDWKLAGSRGSLQKSDDVTLVMGSISQQAKKPDLILHPPEKELIAPHAGLARPHPKAASRLFFQTYVLYPTKRMFRCF